MNRLTSILFIVLFAALTAGAQTQSEDPKLMKIFSKSLTISKAVAQPDDEFWKASKALMYDHQGFEDGHGMYAWPKGFSAFPKRVGILSYIVFDPGFFESSSKTYGYLTVTKTETGFINAETTQQLAQGFYDMSLPEMKKAFAGYGSTLLTPQEFLETDAQKAAYASFDFKEKGLAKMMSKEGAANTLAQPEGFSLYYAENFTMPAFVEAVTAKIKELGLDAAIILKIQMGMKDNTISIQSITCGMYGPNPVPKDPKKKYVAINPATGYHDGVVYNAVKLGAFDMDNMLETNEGLNIVVFAQNKAGARSDFAGFDQLIGRTVAGVIYPLNAWIKGDWKPFKYK